MGVVFGFDPRTVDMIGTGRSYDAEILPPPWHSSAEVMTETRTRLTLRSTPALPKASFNFVTSVVSNVLEAGAGAAAGFTAGAVGIVAICDC